MRKIYRFKDIVEHPEIYIIRSIGSINKNTEISIQYANETGDIYKMTLPAKYIENIKMKQDTIIIEDDEIKYYKAV